MTAWVLTGALAVAIVAMLTAGAVEVGHYFRQARGDDERRAVGTMDGRPGARTASASTSSRRS